MYGDDDSEDIDIIQSQILKSPGREFYPGMFEDVGRVIAELTARAAGRNRPQAGLFLQQRRELSIKAHLIQQWRRDQQRRKQAGDGAPPGPQKER